MNREDVSKLAREAGFGIGPATKSIYANTPCDDQLERFAALVAAAEREKFTIHAAALVRDARHDATEREREACARIADEWATSEQKQYGNGGPGAAIRARGKK